MTQKYFGLLTSVGENKQAAAQAINRLVQITQMAVGDGGGIVPNPSRLQTTLIAEKRRAPLNRLYQDPANPNYLIAELVIPEDAGGWYIRELGLIDADGDLVAVANCPETYKPLLAEGSGRAQVVRLVLMVASTDAFVLKIDPSIVLATRQYADDGLAKKVDKTAVIDVPHGGTGISTLPVGSFLRGNGASPMMPATAAEVFDALGIADAINAIAAGRILRFRLISANQTYVKGAGTKSVLVLGVGGGPAGGGASSTSSTQSSAGGGGSAASWALGLFSGDLSNVFITCGAAGVGVVGGAGGNGSASSFGSLMTIPGGLGGGAGGLVAANTSALTGKGGASPAAPTGGILNVRGQAGGNGLVFPSGSQQGPGGSGPLGTGGGASVTGGATIATGFGAAGSGALNGVSSPAIAGADGTGGGFLLLELS